MYSKKNLNWFIFAKKYWKKIICLFFLATFSTLAVFLVVKNGTGSIYNLIKTGTSRDQVSYTFYWFRQKPLIEFGNNWKGYLLFVGVFIGIFCSPLLILSFYYRDYLVSLVDYDLRRGIIAKLFKLKQKPKMKELPNLVHNQIAIFSNYVVYTSDQFYIFFLSLIVVFWESGLVYSSLLWWGFGYLLVGAFFTFWLNYWLYQKDLFFQRALIKRTQQENNLLNNHQLIIKKGLVNSFNNNYWQISWIAKKRADLRNWVSAVCQTLPDYFWMEFASYFLLIFFPAGDAHSFIFLGMFIRLSSTLRRLIKGLNNLPSYFSAKKQINWFLNQAERDDIQKNLLIVEPITSLRLKDIVFAYKNNEFVLNELSLEFKKGQVNYLKASNGYGKSTVINLIFGFHQPQKGEILVNNKYKLVSLNLNAWREKIAYAEHQNLIDEPLSTGQKQWKDLESVLSQKSKDVFIFDEAGGNLDAEKQKKLEKELEILSKKRLVIVINAV